MFGPASMNFSEWWPGMNKSHLPLPPTPPVLYEPAALALDGLADHVHQICSSNMVVFYHNNIDTALSERNYDFIVSKTTLVMMKPWTAATPTRDSQEVLSKLMHKESIRNVRFLPGASSIDGPEPFDLALISRPSRPSAKYGDSGTWISSTLD